ncbi:metal ABC transporter substrate-binding protein [Sulfurimonas sp.]|uniref:metal ABC transporter substrate-binding protein n=1 Tax=Sulfurimonas sp. TaxID=2022749 RepID=UPI002AB15744|nr:metal ABC transporter substrate-binding protein [Sulfurimonas sp.]
MKDFRNVIFILVIATFLLQMYVSKKDKELQQQNEKQSVAISTFSIYDIAKHISQDTFEITMILPFGVDAHSFEPTPKLMAKILQSDLVIYSGAGLEPWTHSFEFKSRVVDMSKYVKLNSLDADEHSHHAHHAHHEDEASDPHYWLDIQNMIIATKLVCTEFIKLSPKDKELFETNRDNYIKMLESLDAKYKTTLENCKKDTIIVNHNAFSYLSKNYGFGIEALSGLSPDAQPSAKSMVRLIQHIKEHNISTVFFESFVSDKAIKSIANEAKVSVDVLQPLGNITRDEADKKLSYKTIMLENLEKISKALECE